MNQNYLHYKMNCSMFTNDQHSTVATRCESDSEISTDSSATNVLWSQKKKSEFPSLPHLKLPKSGIRRSRTSILRRKACYKLIFLFLKKSWL